jgi:putative heme-binding domain-containing protein
MIRLTLSLLAFLLSLQGYAVVSQDQLPHQAEWISASGESTKTDSATFRRGFEVGSNLIKAVLLATADEHAEIYLNGTRAAGANGFTNAATLDVTSFIRSGTNILALRVTNDSGQAAVRLMLELAFADGKQRWLVTDSSWLASRNAVAGWTNLDFSASGWTSAFGHGAAGFKKWGDPFQATKSPDAYNSWMLARNVDRATDPGTIKVLPGFNVELLRSAQPGEDSWVALAFDPKGRLTISREKVGLLRMTLASDSIERVEVIEDKLLECRGLLYAYDSLYVNANNSKGFYRLRDTDGDDKFDQQKLLLQTEGGVGHGRNQLTLGPDGLIYMAHGDDIVLPPNLDTNSPLKQMADDQLLPSRDPQAPRNVRRFAQVGHVLQTDRDGSFFRLVAGGLRNPYDIAFNESGEMFTYDADMERDIGAPWYHPTRVLHLVSGSDFGWRRSMPNLSPQAPDVLPAALDIGVGSPTGVGFGTKSNFPKKYRRAFFIADWAYGRILAVHLRPEGASYHGSSEIFLTGRPLNVTDFAFGPDGAMYFITGGRGTKSGLYRVIYRDPREEKPALASTEEQSATALRTLRKKIENLGTGTAQQEPASKVVDDIWPYVGHSDRRIRYAARNALERQPLEIWLERALNETDRRTELTALLAAGRTTGKELQARLFSRAAHLLSLPDVEQIEVLRLIALRLARFGRPDNETASTLIKRLDAIYPSTNRQVNLELCRLLSFLRAPNLVAKTTEIIARTRNTADLIHYCQFLATVQQDWTIEHRRIFFDALRRAEQEQGGSDYYSAIRAVRKEVAAQLTATESKNLGDVLSPAKAIPATLGAVDPTLTFVRDWKLEDFDFTSPISKGDSTSGGQLFSKVGCAVCHRFGSEGGVVGPDLTSVASRFGPRDLLDNILNPSKAIDEKYRNISVTMKNGEEVSGMLEREDNETLVLSAGQTGEINIEIRRSDIANRRISEVSPMPSGLLNVLTQKQIFELLAFLERGETNSLRANAKAAGE